MDYLAEGEPIEPEDMAAYERRTRQEIAESEAFRVPAASSEEWLEHWGIYPSKSLLKEIDSGD